ncbi:hypothetical protein HC891_28525 [Candidatus Gracilibacteria bacterium]|nr:hypothetical protein [Candidatus Gracilibacteria bacterium]
MDLSDTAALAASARPYRSRYELRPLVDMSIGERLMLPFQRLGNAADSALRKREIRRTSAPPPPRVRPQGLSYRKQNPPFNWLLLLGLSLVVIILIFYGTTLMSQNDEQRALEYFSAAESRIADVRNANNDAAALERLEFARQAIDEVRATPAVTETNAALWLRYQTLQREYERMLAAVQRLTYFDTPEILATHPAPTGRFSNVVVPPATSSVTDPVTLDGYRYIYALDGDKATARLYRFPRDGGNAEAYLSPSQPVQTTVTGPLRATTWREDQSLLSIKGRAASVTTSVTRVHGTTASSAIARSGRSATASIWRPTTVICMSGAQRQTKFGSTVRAATATRRISGSTLPPSRTATGAPGSICRLMAISICYSRTGACGSTAAAVLSANGHLAILHRRSPPCAASTSPVMAPTTAGFLSSTALTSASSSSTNRAARSFNRSRCAPTIACG